MADVRRTYADLLGKSPVPLLPSGQCTFCKNEFKDNSRVDAPAIHGGVRRYNPNGLICDPCIKAQGERLLPVFRKVAELESAWVLDAQVEGAS